MQQPTTSLNQDARNTYKYAPSPSKTDTQHTIQHPHSPPQNTNVPQRANVKRQHTIEGHQKSISYYKKT